MQDTAYLTVEEAAKYLRLSKIFLDKARLTGGLVPFVKIGRTVRYRKSDLDALAERELRQSTSQEATHEAA